MVDKCTGEEAGGGRLKRLDPAVSCRRLKPESRRDLLDGAAWAGLIDSFPRTTIPPPRVLREARKADRIVS